MPVSPPVIKTTWVFIEFLLETLHGQFLGLLIEQTITFAVARSSVLRTKDHQLPCSPMGNALLFMRLRFAGGTEAPPSRDRNRSPFRNYEPTFGGPLRIVLEHQVTRNTPRLNGARACKRSHHHAVLQLHGSDLNWGEQLICPERFHGSRLSAGAQPFRNCLTCSTNSSGY